MKFTFYQFEPKEFKVDKKELEAGNISDNVRRFNTIEAQPKVGMKKDADPMLGISWFYISRKTKEGKILIEYSGTTFYMVEKAEDYKTEAGQKEINNIVDTAFQNFKGVFDQNKGRLNLDATMPVPTEAELHLIQEAVIRNMKQVLG